MRCEYSERFRAVAQSVANRAREFYRKAGAALPPEDRQAMVAAELMGSVYWRLLRKLEQRQFDVFGSRPTRLGKLHKILLIARTWYRTASGSLAPSYGTP